MLNMLHVAYIGDILSIVNPAVAGLGAGEISLGQHRKFANDFSLQPVVIKQVSFAHEPPAARLRRSP
jgi:hypothetical protein